MSVHALPASVAARVHSSHEIASVGDAAMCLVVNAVEHGRATHVLVDGDELFDECVKKVAACKPIF